MGVRVSSVGTVGTPVISRCSPGLRDAAATRQTFRYAPFAVAEEAALQPRGQDGSTGAIAGKVVDEDGEPSAACECRLSVRLLGNGAILESKATRQNDRGNIDWLLTPGATCAAYLHTNPPAPPGPHTGC